MDTSLISAISDASWLDMSLISAISDAYWIHASLFKDYQWRVFTRHWYALITDARTVTRLLRVTDKPLDASLISFSGIVTSTTLPECRGAGCRAGVEAVLDVAGDRSGCHITSKTGAESKDTYDSQLLFFLWGEDTIHSRQPRAARPNNRVFMDHDPSDPVPANGDSRQWTAPPSA
jgi:hypothetical protein